MDKQQALDSFWNQYGIPAYNEVKIPKDAEPPYITYQKLFADFEATVYPTAAIWTRSDSWEEADRLENLISETIEGGFTVPVDTGHIQINKGTPFSEEIKDETDDLIKGYRITLQVSYLCAH